MSESKTLCDGLPPGDPGHAPIRTPEGTAVLVLDGVYRTRVKYRCRQCGLVWTEIF